VDGLDAPVMLTDTPWLVNTPSTHQEPEGALFAKAWHEEGGGGNGAAARWETLVWWGNTLTRVPALLRVQHTEGIDSPWMRGSLV
jgi:hypothetical protein